MWIYLYIKGSQHYIEYKFPSNNSTSISSLSWRLWTLFWDVRYSYLNILSLPVILGYPCKHWFHLTIPSKQLVFSILALRNHVNLHCTIGHISKLYYKLFDSSSEFWNAILLQSKLISYSFEIYNYFYITNFDSDTKSICSLKWKKNV